MASLAALAPRVTPMSVAARWRAPTAICIHGAGGGGWEWAIWQRVFGAQGWNVLAPDLMPAQDGLERTGIEDYVAQVTAWCAASPSAPVLIGASLGGLLALLCAPRVAPAALVLINPLPPASLRERAAARDYPDIVAWGRARSLDGTRRAMPDADDAACLFAFRRWRDESGAVLRAAAAGVPAAAPLCPLLVVASELDHDVPPAASRALAQHLGGSFSLLPGASHVGPLLGRCANGAARAALAWCEQVLCDKV
jgi:pimeloyl-ACP methyl ester carboxylesterase